MGTRGRTSRLVLLVGALVVAASWVSPGAAAVGPSDAIFTIAGTGVVGSCCDGGPATLADLNHPRGFAVTADGGLLVVEAFGQRVRRIAPNGTITTVAGTGVAGYSGDGGLATNARLRTPHAVVALADGGFLIDDTNNFRIRRVGPDGIITTVAGTGAKGYSGDGGPATRARISAPRGIDGTPDGTILIADTDNNRIRSVDVNGIITTVAGTGVKGFAGDGGSAKQARLNRPYGVTVAPGGGFLVTDTSNNRVRQVAPTGIINTIAGTGARGFSGDGGPAASARLSEPDNSAVLADGRLLIADTQNNRVRQVSPGGLITTFSGSGTYGFAGEGAAPTTAQLALPTAVVAFGSGVVIADAENHRVRYVGSEPIPAPTPGGGRVVIDGNRTYSGFVVDVGVPAAFATQVRLSSSPATQGGVLTAGTTYPYTTSVPWNLADAATGGSSLGGRRLVYAQWAGPDDVWSPVVADSVFVDTTPPTSSAPQPSVGAGEVLGSTSMPVTLTWSAGDDASGVASSSLQRSTDGGPFTAVAFAPVDAQSATLQLQPGSTYAFRVQPSDVAGNVGAWEMGPTFALEGVQDADPRVAFAGLWTSELSSAASGGSFASSVTAGATASLEFDGFSVSWAAPRTRERSMVQVYIDGALVAIVDQAASSYQPRRVIFVWSWPTSGAHTIQLRNLATSGRPEANVDALVVLR